MGYVPIFDDDEEGNFLEKLPENAPLFAYRAARRKSFDASDAEDARQMAFEELLNQPEKLECHPYPDRLLYAVAKYRSRDIAGRRRRQLDQEVPLTRWDPPGDSQGANCGMGAQDMPAELTVPHPVDRYIELEEAKERVAKVATVVRKLSRKQRRIFGQCIVRKRSRQMVAKELGMNYGTLRNEVVRINQLLWAAVFGAQDG
jgi:DNA-directed RNA polymerase specialized sigma24 family protein